MMYVCPVLQVSYLFTLSQMSHSLFSLILYPSSYSNYNSSLISLILYRMFALSYLVLFCVPMLQWLDSLWWPSERGPW